ncbi:hypothetical protein HIMB11_00805 [Rhodobacteraceae bacterium HIMB11]|nr:hypothetical protein HIMB11_00805 [Rhodobacteraceae bacterium HIMB11]
MPVMLSELGASAGFNLLLDRYNLNAGRTLQPADDPIVTLSPDWMGVIPAKQPLKIIDRAGVDINPLNSVDRLDYLRLLSYTWAGQCDRLDRVKQIAPPSINKSETSRCRRLVAKSTKRTAHWHIAFRVPHNRPAIFPTREYGQIRTCACPDGETRDT